MAFLEQISISGVRNLKPVKLVFSPGVNVFVGQNGSGKTSCFEAVFLLGVGRSFRATHLRQVQQFSAKSLVVSGMVVPDGSSSGLISMGIAFDQEKKQVRIEGKARKSADLARMMPIRLIDVHSLSLLEGGPQLRRDFIDWGLFHVEQDFYLVWGRFKRALLQRNSLLKQGITDALEGWDREYIAAAQLLHEARERYLNHFLPVFCDVADVLLKARLGDITLAYDAGWGGESLANALTEKRGVDRTLKYTTQGPHRGDLLICVDGLPAKTVFSRGQTKLFVAAMLVAQAVLLGQQKQATGQVLFLMDDLASELDKDAVRRILDYLKTLKSQVFISVIDEASLDAKWLAEEKPKMFYVEQGRFCHEYQPVEQAMI